MSRKKCHEVYEPVQVHDKCAPKTKGIFGNVICLIIILIVLEFLCGVLGNEEICDC
jgi:t-SNARE complex subunit (syntaxin)